MKYDIFEYDFGQATYDLSLLIGGKDNEVGEVLV